AKRKRNSRPTAQTERRTRSSANRAGARSATRRIGRSKRTAIWEDSRARKKIKGTRNRAQTKAAIAPRGSDGGRYCASCFELDRNSGIAIAGGRTAETAPTRGSPARAGGWARRGNQGRGKCCPSGPRRFAGSESPDRLIYFPRTDRSWKNRALPRVGRIPVRRRERNDSHRYERIYGEAHGRASDRSAAGLRRIRRRRTTLRGRPAA